MNKTWMMVAMAAVAGCVELDDTEEMEGTVEQLASVGVLTQLNRSDNLPVSANTIDLAPKATRTCFLAGVGGSLSSSAGSFTPAGQLYTSATAGIRGSGDRWVLEAFGGASLQKIMARSICTNLVTERIGPVSWNNTFQSGPRKIADHLSGRRCFLTQVSNNDEYYTDAKFGSSGDYVRVYVENNEWFITGSGQAAGEAMCVKVSTDFGEFSGTNTSIFPIVVNLADNDTNPGTQCMLTKVGGTFRSSDFNGVTILLDSDEGRWKMILAPGRTARARCIQ